MTLTFVTRILTIIGIGMALAVALAQDTPADKNQSQAPAVTGSHPAPTAAASKPEPAPAAPSEKEAEAPAPAAKAESTAITSEKAAPAPSMFQSHKDRVSYAFGVDLARDLKRQKNDLNLDLLTRALTDALADKPLALTDDEVTAIVKQVEIDQKHDYEHAKMMISERNRRESEAFFAENAKKEGVVILPSGLQYKILKKGDGKMPTLEDTVLCNYRGTLLDGTEIDSSYTRKEPATVPLKGVIPGWRQALQMMPVGSKWQLFIPPQLAYGDKPTKIFGPNTALILEVEVLSIQEKAQTASAANK